MWKACFFEQNLAFFPDFACGKPCFTRLRQQVGFFRVENKDGVKTVGEIVGDFFEKKSPIKKYLGEFLRILLLNRIFCRGGVFHVNVARAIYGTRKGDLVTVCLFNGELKGT